MARAQKRTTSAARPAQQASDDVTVPRAPDNAGSTDRDPDHERAGGMSGGLGSDSGPTQPHVYVDDAEMVRQLRLLERTVEQLEAAFIADRIDAHLLDEIDTLMENGIGADERSHVLVDLLDNLRAHTEADRAELFHEAVADRERVKAALEELIEDMS